jgi:hypothetical protein
MYYNFNCYVSYFKLVCIIILIIMLFNLFFRFIVHEINSKMVKSRIGVLTGREKTDVAVGWKLQPAAETVLGERERES